MNTLTTRATQRRFHSVTIRPVTIRRLVARFATSLAMTCIVVAGAPAIPQERTEKPPLHGRQWMAITGKPLGATAGARIFHRGGNAVDAACAMIAATATMWDVLHWGGETQALIWHPKLRKVIAINALGVAPSGATAEFFKAKGMKYPPEFGPLAAVTPGTPGGILVMLAEYGRLSLAEVLAPAIELADGYPIEAQTANLIERNKSKLKEWPDSARVMLPYLGLGATRGGREGPAAGEIFRQPELAATLRKLVEAEADALARGASRKDAIMAAYERFYRGDIASEFASAVQAQGGLITRQDLAHWQVKIEEPRKVNYRGIDVYKLDVWTQGPSMLQALNILENFDLKSMGYNSSRYLHTVYQAMNLAFADRDFYYGDPTFAPAEPVDGLLSKDYAKQRAASIGERNDAAAGPGDPYPFQGGTNPYAQLLRERSSPAAGATDRPRPPAGAADRPYSPAGVAPTIANRAGVTERSYPLDDEAGAFWRGTTSVVAADAEGWLVSVTPSGGWVPAVIAGKTGIGLSQRMQSFVVDASENPFNVVEPGKRPRVTLTPSLAVRDGKPWLAFAVQGGDSQDQNLLQFFLNVAEFGMTPQEATEAANMNSFQLRDSFGNHETSPGRMLLDDETPRWIRSDLTKRGYRLEFQQRTAGPINAIMLDHEHGTFWGGSGNHGEDYGIAW
jgi:gamma-glutamyltranspeptidase/glutathione hydrolase